MSDMNERSALLLGEDKIEILKKAKVIVFGLGGVGSYVCEALARCAVGNITIVDNDTVDETNINRQLPATYNTVGKLKTDVVKERILSINPKCNVEALTLFYTPETHIDFSKFDYVVDAIDTVKSKLDIAEKTYRLGVKEISCMGAGNKLDPTMFRVCDIYKTSVCPLAKVMRKELKARGVKKLKVVFSPEEPIKPKIFIENKNKRQSPGSVSFVPSVAGLIAAGEVIKDIVGI